MKQFTWAGDATFTLTGKEFELLYNVLKQKMATPEMQEAIQTINMFTVLQAKFEAGLAAGTVTEVNIKAEPIEDVVTEG